MEIKLKCGLCGDYRDFTAAIREYDTPENISVIAWPCWCWQCQTVSLAEYIPELTEIIEEARAWKQQDRRKEYRIHCGPMHCGQIDDKLVVSVLAYYDAVLSWRKQRRSSSRCLFCGATMVGLAANRFGKFEHPECGGMFNCYLAIFGGIRRMPKGVFSSEGIKLSEEQVVA